MRIKKTLELIKHVNLISVSVPAGIIIASAVFPLKPIIQQAFIGIIVVWFGIEAMTGFDFMR